ncbi:MAG: hypothetical protein LUE26_08025 [Alistipes sp.]|nr:hypothetical protein [Alistipes sp.]
MIGYYLLRTVGVATAWVLGNIVRFVMQKPHRSYSEIWNGDDLPDYLDRMNYNLIYCGIGAAVIGIFIFLTI